MTRKNLFMRSAAMLSIAGFLLSAAAFDARAQQAPDAMVKNVTDEVVAIIKQDKDIQSGNVSKAQQLIEDKLVPHFDFNRMTALAMGRSWRQATPEQQQKLIEQFRTLLVRTYAGALSNYRDQKFEVKPVRAQPGDNDVVVKTEVVRQGGQPIPIDYSLTKTNNDWKAYDVVVAGVSLVTNYRDEFNGIVRDSGVDGLIKALSDKNKGPAPPPAPVAVPK